MSKTIVKLDNLSATFDANHRFVTIGICGPSDNVRIAARDLIYGLGVIWSVDGKFDHVSEVHKMHGRPFEGDHAQINISLSVKEFGRIVTLFRYCERVGMKLPGSEYMMSIDRVEGGARMMDITKDDNYHWEYSDEKNGLQVSGMGTLGAYLVAAKAAADCNHDEMIIEKTDKPFNRLFWTQAELEADALAKEKVYQGKKSMLGFFGVNNKMSPAERKKEMLTIEIEHIISRVEDMFFSHPKNVANYSQRILARDLLYQYLSMKAEHPEIDPVTRYADHFLFVRDDEREKFAELAAKLDRLETELAEIKKAEQDEKDVESVISCPVL